jgi:hypothetical protein
VTDAEAAELAALVDSLWNVGRGDTWRAFYGNAIADLDYTDALRAITELFATEAFAPVAAKVVHLALGVDDAAAQLAFSATAEALAVDGPLDGVCRRAWIDAFGALAPLDGPAYGRQVDAFVRSWRHRKLNAGGLDALTSGYVETGRVLEVHDGTV